VSINCRFWVSTEADENLPLRERFSRVDTDTLLYEATITDAIAYIRPWTFVLPLARTSARIFEFACYEGNYALANILRGARVQAHLAPEQK
jgi:hypothetical protein